MLHFSLLSLDSTLRFILFGLAREQRRCYNQTSNYRFYFRWFSRKYSKSATVFRFGQVLNLSSFDRKLNFPLTPANFSCLITKKFLRRVLQHWHHFGERMKLQRFSAASCCHSRPLAKRSWVIWNSHEIYIMYIKKPYWILLFE